MLPDSFWSDNFNKSEVHLKLKGIEQENFTTNCLLQTEFLKGRKNNNERFTNFNPNLVMNIRHELVKESSKAFRTPRGLVEIEGLKILREENHNRLQKHKEGKLVKREIIKLKQILENRRIVMQKKLQETNDRVEALLNRSKPIKFQSKLPRKVEHCDTLLKMNAWLTCSSQLPIEIKEGQHEILAKDMQMPLKKCCLEKTPELVSCPKRNLTEKEGKCKNHFWEKDKENYDVKNKFLGNHVGSLEQKFPNVAKKEINIESFPLLSNRLNQKSVRHILENLKENSQHKNQIETKINRQKIEQFLLKLKETKMKGEKSRTLVNNRARIKIREKREKDDEVVKKLKKLMQEVKSSQKEVHQKLQGAKTTIEIDTKFLMRMEERNKERAKRWKALEEKKLKIEEEKKNIQRQKEEEQKQKDEQEKRKKFEEFKKKQRAEKQKKEAQKRDKEKLRLRIGLAKTYYRVYLLRGWGLRPWVRLLKGRKAQQQQAESFFERKLKQKTLHRWVAKVREEIDLKVKCAVAFYEKVVKRNSLAIWIEYRAEGIMRSQVAMDWYDSKLTEKAFKKWLLFAKCEQLECKIKEGIAALHYQKKLQKMYVQKLRNYPVLKRLEQAKEYRKGKWRQKVKEILPDYKPDVSIFEDL